MKSDSNLIIAVIASGVLFFILGMHYERNNPPEKKGNSYQEKEENYTPQEKGISFQGEIENDINSEELSGTIDSLKKVAAAELPISCSFEYLEDINFNKYVSITIFNNTKEEINSVLLNITYSSFQNNLGNDTNFELKTRATIRPGMSKTIKHETEYNINQIEVVKYSSNGKVEYNGFDAFVRENRRNLDKQFPPGTF
jgi:hypothetical protein